MIGRWFRRVFAREAKRTGSESAEWKAMSTRVANERADRKAAVGPRREVADAISAVLFRHDPIGINFEDNTDEYDAEAESIVLRLATVPAIDSPDEIEVIVHDEFVRWFDAQLAGPPERYREIAREIWDLWSAIETDRT